MKPVNITDATFETEVLQSDSLVLVDFWAPWCAPCRMIAPVLEEISKEYAGRVKVTKLNTDENQSMAMKYNIMSIPTIKIFRGGVEVGEIIGAAPKNQIVDQVNYFMQGATVLN